MTAHDPRDDTTDTTEKAPPHGGAFSSALTWILSSMNALGSVWIFVLMILINADALGRTLFAAPIDGVNEMIELSLVGIIFLQLGDATRRGRLTRSDGFSNLVLRYWPAVGRVMAAIFDLTGALFMAVILWGSVPLLTESITEGYFVGNEGVFTAPVWPIKLIIVVGCFVTLLQFVAFAWRHLKGSQA